MLNKLLKSTDFKASRLVKSTARTPNNEVSGKKMAKVDFYDAELLNLINDLNDWVELTAIKWCIVYLGIFYYAKIK